RPITTERRVESPTPANKRRRVEKITQAEQQQSQLQQQQAQMQIELLKAQSEKLQASAIADSGRGMERASRIQENSALAVERKAEAQKDRELGALHYVKALKELQDMDRSQIEKM